MEIQDNAQNFPQINLHANEELIEIHNIEGNEGGIQSLMSPKESFCHNIGDESVVVDSTINANHHDTETFMGGHEESASIA
jgi:hypothetical protein